MRNTRIAKRYAKALMSLGREDGHYQRYGRELREFSNLLEPEGEFFRALTFNLYPLENRRRLLDAVLEKSGFSILVINFLRLLVEKERIAQLSGILDHYDRLADEISNVTRASIESARPLDQSSVKKVVSALENITTGDVRAEVVLDESLIGGIRVRIGDLVLDGSVKSQLAGLTESLKRGEYS